MHSAIEFCKCVVQAEFSCGRFGMAVSIAELWVIFGHNLVFLESKTELRENAANKCIKKCRLVEGQCCAMCLSFAPHLSVQLNS